MTLTVKPAAFENRPEFVTYKQCKMDSETNEMRKACKEDFKNIKEETKVEVASEKVFECREAVMTALEDSLSPCTDECVPKKYRE